VSVRLTFGCAKWVGRHKQGNDCGSAGAGQSGMGLPQLQDLAEGVACDAFASLRRRLQIE
jgi:hypothetical protein